MVKGTSMFDHRPSFCINKIYAKTQRLHRIANAMNPDLPQTMRIIPLQNNKTIP
jgi:hypothetical protein